MRWLVLYLMAAAAGAQTFPVGFYEMPAGDAELRAMAAAGVNLVHCRNRADLDRAAAAGMRGWITVPMQLGDDARLREAVEAVRDHPALAVWEGPDEVVWNFTGASELYHSGVYTRPDEWKLQTPRALAHAARTAADLMPKLRAGAALVRKLDGGRHPLWINEAAPSDMPLIREYIDAVDITGCDTYPVKGRDNDDIGVVGDYTRRFLSIGRGLPVWMVLQGFSWSLLPDHAKQQPGFPTFAQTRTMAYDAIASGASAVLYWGTYVLRPEHAAFRESLYAMTRELSALQPFLSAPEQIGITVTLTEANGRSVPGDRGVRRLCRKSGSDWLVALVNEDDHEHSGVELAGLGLPDGARLELLYGEDTVTVRHSGFVTRLKPFEAKVFASSRRWQSGDLAGRDYPR